VLRVQQRTKFLDLLTGSLLLASSAIDLCQTVVCPGVGRIEFQAGEEFLGCGAEIASVRQIVSEQEMCAGHAGIQGEGALKLAHDFLACLRARLGRVIAGEGERVGEPSLGIVRVRNEIGDDPAAKIDLGGSGQIGEFGEQGQRGHVVGVGVGSAEQGRDSCVLVLAKLLGDAEAKQKAGRLGVGGGGGGKESARFGLRAQLDEP
jgi:hypothetical protein